MIYWHVSWYICIWWWCEWMNNRQRVVTLKIIRFSLIIIILSSTITNPLIHLYINSNHISADVFIIHSSYIHHLHMFTVIQNVQSFIHWQSSYTNTIPFYLSLNHHLSSCMCSHMYIYVSPTYLSMCTCCIHDIHMYTTIQNVHSFIHSTNNNAYTLFLFDFHQTVTYHCKCVCICRVMSQQHILWLRYHLFIISTHPPRSYNIQIHSCIMILFHSFHDVGHCFSIPFITMCVHTIISIIYNLYHHISIIQHQSMIQNDAVFSRFCSLNHVQRVPSRPVTSRHVPSRHNHHDTIVNHYDLYHMPI